MAEPKMEDVFALYEQKVALLSSAQKEKLLAARDEGMTHLLLGVPSSRPNRSRGAAASWGRTSRFPLTISTGLLKTGSTME